MSTQGQVIKKCLEYIRNNTPEDAIDKISKLKRPNGSDEIIGCETAYKIYYTYKEESEKYSYEKYGTQSTKYQTIVENNSNRAKKYSKKNIKKN